MLGRGGRTRGDNLLVSGLGICDVGKDCSTETIFDAGFFLR